MSSGHRLRRCCHRMLAARDTRSETTAGSLRASSTAPGQGSRGGICLGRRLARGRQCGSATAATLPMAPGTGSWPRSWLRPMLLKKSTGRSRWIPRLPAPISMGPTPLVLISPQGAGSNHKNPGTGWLEEPEGHAMGRSRGGLSSKLHAAVDGNGMPLAVVLTGGQRNDGAVLVEVID